MTCSATHWTTNTSEVERFGLRSFASSAVFTWPLANPLSLLQASRQLFAGKTLPQPAGSRKCFPTVHRIQKHGFLCYRNKHLFLIGKNGLIVMAPMLMNKDVSEPSYNGLEFTVQNRNYFCTNLMIMSLTNMCQVSTVNKALGWAIHTSIYPFQLP